MVNAINGNFAALDANGNLTDSGSKASDFLTTHQDISGKADKVTSATNGNFAALDANGNLTDSGHKHSDYLMSHQTIPVTDVQVNGTSVLSNGVANIPLASAIDNGAAGVVKSGPVVKVNSNGVLTINVASVLAVKNGTNQGLPITPSRQHDAAFYGLAKAAGDTTQSQSDNAVGTYTDDAKASIRTMLGAVGDTDYASYSTPGVIKVGEGVSITNGVLSVIRAMDGQVKIGAASFRPVVPASQHLATFYGLAKAAGDTTQSQSDNAVGTYTETAQSKIHEMLDAPVAVSGTDPVITGKAGVRYICGECDTLTLTPPASGIVDVTFTSGTTATVLSVPNTVKWPEWFNPNSLETSATYEISIMDGALGAVGKWI